MAAEAADVPFRYAEKNGQITITGWLGTGGAAEIPSEINGKPVTRIGNRAFGGSVNLVSVTVPDSVAEIGEGVFEGCTGLTSAVLSDHLTEIPKAAFYGCTSLKSFSFPENVERIGENAFYECASLPSVPFPESVTEIGEYAFFGCEGIESLTVPAGVKKVGASAFFDCLGLTSLTISSGVEEIGNSSFKNCVALTSVTTPDSLKSIGEYSFRNCTALTAVTLAQGVSSIGRYAFYNCQSLTSAVIPSSVTAIGKNAFGKCTAVTITGVPGSYAQTYAQEQNIPFTAASLQNTSYLSKTTVPKLTMVTVTGRSEMGKGNVTYAFSYKKSTSTSWTTVGTKFGDTKEVTLVPNMPATYYILVRAKDESGKIVATRLTLTVTAPTEADLVNKSTITKLTAVKGEAIGLTGKATGGVGDYTYAFYYRKQTSRTFTPVATPYTSKTKVFFKPASPVAYVVRICVKDAEGTVAVKEYTLFVSE